MNSYKNPLEERYSSEEMLFNFSHNNKFRNWRKLWIALAEIEKDLGLDITDEQIAELKANAENIDYDAAAAYEKKFRHDVMAHVHAYGDVAPSAKGIIHLGATSAFVGDNTDLIQIRDGLQIIRKQLVNVIKNLSDFSTVNAIWIDWMKGCVAPSRATIQADLVNPNWLIEIAVTAAQN